MGDNVWNVRDIGEEDHAGLSMYFDIVQRVELPTEEVVKENSHVVRC